jgi:hypothetical protein
MEWKIIRSQEQSTMADSWAEYLCARATWTAIELGIGGEAVLGEIPREWLDEHDGTPLPEFQDEHGDLKLPAEFAGSRVSGHDGEYILGDVEVTGDTVSISYSELTLEKVTDALQKLGWPTERVDEEVFLDVQAMFLRITTRHIASAVAAPFDDGNCRPLGGPFSPDPVVWARAFLASGDASDPERVLRWFANAMASAINDPDPTTYDDPNEDDCSRHMHR